MKTLKAFIIVLSVVIVRNYSTNNHRTVDDILDSSFRVYQISGYEGPKIDIKKNSLAEFLTALHYKIPLSKIQNALKWNPETTERNIHALIRNKLLTKKGDYYYPTLGIITLDRGKLLEEKAQKVANQIADSIHHRLPEIKGIHDQTNILQQHDFGNCLSFISAMSFSIIFRFNGWKKNF